MTYREGAGHVRPPAAHAYRLFAEATAPQPVAKERAPNAEAKSGQPVSRRRFDWTASLPFVARSIVLTPGSLLVAGGESLPETTEPNDPGILWLVSRSKGAKQAACPLPAPPILDGMALADAGLFPSTIRGSVVCLRSAKDQAATDQTP